MKHCTILVSFLLGTSVLPALAAPHSRELNDNWRFRLLAGDAQTHIQAQSVHWHSAQVPGISICSHTV